VQFVGEMPLKDRATAIKPDSRYVAETGTKVKECTMSRLLPYRSGSSNGIRNPLLALWQRTAWRILTVWII